MPKRDDAAPHSGMTVRPHPPSPHGRHVWPEQASGREAYFRFPLWGVNAMEANVPFSNAA